MMLNIMMIVEEYQIIYNDSCCPAGYYPISVSFKSNVKPSELIQNILECNVNVILKDKHLLIYKIAMIINILILLQK